MKQLDRYSKTEVIIAIQWMFGISKRKATLIYKSTDAIYHNEIVDGFKSNATSTFYSD